MKFIDSLFNRGGKKYIKSPITGKVTSIAYGKIIIETEVIEITSPLVQVGSIVKKGDIIGF